MLALSSQLNQLRTSRKQIAGKIEGIRRQIQFENRPNAQYTASGLKRNRDEKEEDNNKTRRSSLRPDDLPDISEPVLKKPKISSIVAQVQPEPVAPPLSADTSEPWLDAQSSSAADADMTDSGAADNNNAQMAPKKRSRQTDMIRNKRMFGALLGHLNKAKESITVEKQAEKSQRRATVEQHVQERIQSDTAQIREEKLKKLQEEMELERENLNKTMEKLVQTENKMKAARLVEKHIRHAGLIQTIAEPLLFWKPRLHTSRTKNMLLRSRKKTKEALRETIAKWGFTSVEEFEDMLKEKKPIVNGTTKKRPEDEGDDEGGEDHDEHSSNDEEDQNRDKENDDDQGEKVNAVVDVSEEQQQPAPTELLPSADEDHNDAAAEEDDELGNKEGVVVVVGEVEAEEEEQAEEEEDQTAMNDDVAES